MPQGMGDRRNTLPPNMLPPGQYKPGNPFDVVVGFQNALDQFN